MLRVLIAFMLFASTASAAPFQSHDGTVLNIEVHVPEADGPRPTILLTHGWGESIQSGTTRTFIDHFVGLGYVVVAYDSRGFGASGGEVELDGPNEVQDARALIDHIATLDTVLLDAPGDPRLGMVGQSYAGGIQFLTAVQDPRIDAIAPFATWSNLLTSLAPNDVLKRGWIDLLYASGTTSSRGVPLGSTDPGAYGPDPAGGTTSKLDEWYLTSLATNEASDEMRHEVGVVRSLTPGALEVPTFLAQGWPDTLFTPDDALATFLDLRMRGVDARLALFHGGHGGFGAYASDEAVMAALDDFLAQHLLDREPQLPPYPVLRYRYQSDDLVGELQWPPAQTTSVAHFLTDDGLRPEAGPFSQQLVVPPAPSHCTEVANFQAQTAGRCGPGPEGTFLQLATAPLGEDTEVTGTPLLRLHASTSQTQEMFLFFHLRDVAPDGSSKPVLHQVMPVRVPASQMEIVLPLATVSHLFPAGHSIALGISTTDLTFHGAREPGVITLGVSGDSLVLPVVPQDAWGDRTPPQIEMLEVSVWADRASAPAATGPADGTNDTASEAPAPVPKLRVRFLLTDDLALGDVNVTAPGARFEWNVTGDHLAQVLDVHVLDCRASLTIIVKDLAGSAEQQEITVMCEQVHVDEFPLSADKNSPGLPLGLWALAVVVARRWSSAG